MRIHAEKYSVLELAKNHLEEQHNIVLSFDEEDFVLQLRAITFKLQDAKLTEYWEEFMQQLNSESEH